MDQKKRGYIEDGDLQNHHRKRRRNFEKRMDEGREFLKKMEQACGSPPDDLGSDELLTLEVPVAERFEALHVSDDAGMRGVAVEESLDLEKNPKQSDLEGRRQENESSQPQDNVECKQSPIGSNALVAPESSKSLPQLIESKKLSNYHRNNRSKTSKKDCLSAKEEEQSREENAGNLDRNEIQRSATVSGHVDGSASQSSDQTYKNSEEPEIHSESQGTSLPENCSEDRKRLQKIAVNTKESCSTDHDHEDFDPSDLDELFDSSGNFSKKFENLLALVFFPASNINLRDVLNMVQSIYLRFNLSKEARYVILDMIKTIAGPEFKDLKMSHYYISQFCKPKEDNKTYTFYCPQCFKVISEPLLKKDVKKNSPKSCSHRTKSHEISTRNNNFYINMNVEYLLRCLFQNEEVLESLLANVSKIEENQDTQTKLITDVHDSEIYREAKKLDRAEEGKREDGENQEKGIKETRIHVKAGVNSDGGTMFENTNFSLWPILLLILELPPKLRAKFALLAAALYTFKEPNHHLMNSFMGSFLEQLSKLMHKGMVIFDRKRNRTIRLFVTPLLFVVDSVARPILQARKQFNAHYGCSWCYAFGEFMSGSMRYLVSDKAPIRTQQEYLKDLEKRKRVPKDKKGERVYRGVRDRSMISELITFFDSIWGYPPEYMHGVVLGVTKQFWDFLNKSTCSFKLSPKNLKLIDKRLASLRSLKAMYRTPDQLGKRAKWKAADWLYWLIFYSIPCYRLVLQPDLFKSYCLFVKTIRSLLSSNISETTLKQCERDLTRFVEDCEKFFGPEFMTFNVHSLLHLVQSVRMSGPLWASSAFPFESEIGILRKFVSGTTNVLEQITEHVLEQNEFSCRVLSDSSDRESLKFCKKVMSRDQRIENYHKTNEGAIVPFCEKDLIKNEYNRCIFRNMAIHSTSYTRPQRTDDTLVLLADGRIAQVLSFFLTNNDCYARVREIDVTPIDVGGVIMDHISIVTKKGDAAQDIPITLIATKMLHLEVINDLEYVCYPLDNCDVR